ncbi:hypothetical protein GCM10020331_066390 [Ectobacillus funiculus]
MGGILGGSGLFLILLCSQFAILSVEQFYQYSIPMAEVVRRLNPTFSFFSSCLLFFGEVFTTLVGNVFGMSKQVHSMTGWKGYSVVLVILFISYCISYIGYGPLLHTLYPLIGWLSIIFLPLIIMQGKTKL